MNTVDIDINTISVLIVDDQKIIRRTLQSYLEIEADINVLGSAENGAMALAQVAELNPNVVIIDLEMPYIDGITTIKVMRDKFPNTKALVFSSHEEREYINDAIVAGAKGYLLKGTSPSDIVNAIRRVDRGYFHLGVGLLDKLSASTATSLQSTAENTDIIVDRIGKKTNVDTSPGSEDNFPKLSRQSQQLTDLETVKMQVKLIERLEIDLHNLNVKQTATNVYLQKLNQKFYWLLASQIILFIIGIAGSKMK
jgi:DNA-binding NarL/FixJ family response regulator